MAKRNPIERRLDILHDHWTEFAEGERARLLVWTLQPDEASMVEAFVERESDAESCQTPDTFLRFQAPFTNPEAHGYVLRQALIDQYEAARPHLEREGLDASWQCPKAAHGDSDQQALIRALASFHSHHVQSEGGLLGCWLDPEHAKDTKAYLLWLQRLMHQTPPEVRWFVTDLAGAPAHAPLAQAEPELTSLVEPKLDMPGAMREISTEAGNLDSPGGQLRQMLVALGNAATEGNLPLSAEIAQRAVAHATSVGWPHLAAVAQMTMGSVYAAHGKSLEAIQAYSDVERLGAEAQAAPEPAEGEDDVRAYGLRLRLQARFGQGSTLIAMQAWEKAAEVFLHAAPFAEQLEDVRSQLDALRLASFCYEQLGDVHRAWDAGMRGFTVGSDMDEDTRKTSSFPYLGEALLRLTANAAYASHARPLEQQMVAMMGEDWRPDPTKAVDPSQLPSFVDSAQEGEATS